MIRQRMVLDIILNPEVGTRHHSTLPLPFSRYIFPNIRMRTEGMQGGKEKSDPNSKNAKLLASRKERIKIPNYDGSRVHGIGDFFSHPSGVESLLNIRALQSFQHLGPNIYRCTLPKMQLLKFEVVPVLDLRVTSTDADCIVEMLCCKFEGSDTLKNQNQHFSAFMRNHITWDAGEFEPWLDLDVQLNVTLEVYTPPFTLLPISTIETPGNLILQGLVDRLVPLLTEQILLDYHKWIQMQSQSSLPVSSS